MSFCIFTSSGTGQTEHRISAQQKAQDVVRNFKQNLILSEIMSVFQSITIKLISFLIIIIGCKDKPQKDYVTTDLQVSDKHSQKMCERQKQIDSAMLLKFSVDLKQAVMTTDMSKIANFLKFPFRNSRCGHDSINLQDSIISRTAFESSVYRDFFGCWFMETISKGYISSQLEVYQKGGGCKFTFSYPACFYLYRSTCKKHNFCVEKVDGQYLITSSWLSD